ncbi:phosphatase PAP2 family protein [Silvanigrella sp.]|jgi:membrane-associated phospholipid phosphatase|uniref:phosphatase PAP2 family protein n=1 Tax=Silvanigrella sp. TaxID=2024976 RepID=UPI0037CB05A2
MKKKLIKICFINLLFIQLIIFSIVFFDKKLAHLINEIHIHSNQFKFILFYETPKWISYIPYILFALSPLMIVFIAFNMCFKKDVKKIHIAIFLLAITLNIALGMKVIFKFIFSRNNVIYFLKTNNDNFKWFQDFHSISAFPSGHTIIVVSASTLFYLVYPKYRIFYFIGSFLIILSLILLQFHFLSDILSAIYLGSIISFFVYFSFKYFAKKEYSQHI